MLHGLWTPGSGLALWRHPAAETPPRSVPTASDRSGGEDDAVPRRESGVAHRGAVRGREGAVAGTVGSTLAGPLGDVLRAARFRHRAEVLIPGADGPERVVVPAHALAPVQAAEVLLSPLPDAEVAADLRYLGHVARWVARWVRAGRVVPEVRREDGAWWVRWRLVGGQRQRAWLAELAAAMPPALRIAGRPTAVLENLVAELADPIVRRHVVAEAARAADRREPVHPLVTALVTEEPLETGSHRVAGALDEWRTSLTVGEPELVLRLAEPDDEDPARESAAVDALWPLEVCLRMEGEAPQPVPIHGDPALVRLAGEKVTAAVQAYPRLRDLPRDPRGMDFLLPTQVVQDLVAHGAQALRSAGVHLLLPRSWRIVAPTMRVQVASPAATETAVGLSGLVSYRWELALGDTVLTPAEMSRLVQAKSDLVRLRGQWVQADHRMLAAAAAYLQGRTDETVGTMGQLLTEIAASGVQRVPLEEVTATGWAAELFAATRTPDRVDPPAALKAELRPYQLRGLAWLATMNRLGCGGILADDMGLGKTVQVLALLLHERETAASVSGPGPTLLVCPMSVVGNWQREAERFAPDLRVLVHHGPARRTGAEFDAAVADSDLVITTYALLARDAEEHRRQDWQRIVLDEAQHIKNAGTRQARAARLLPARHRLALTGTPVENRLEELRSILDFAARGILGKPADFHSRFAVPIERERDENAVTRLRAITAPFVLRRVKTDPAVISDLPDKIEMTVRANLTVEQAALYQAVVDDMLSNLKNSEGIARKGAVLAALTRLKQVCNHPAHFLGDGSSVLRRGRHRSGKLALVEDVLESVLADGEKALLFTQFREFGELIAPYLSERFGHRIPFLHGGVSKTGRDAMVTAFQDDPGGPPLMLLSLKAGGTGLNLTAANHVVHLDRWWNPAVENQATDRAFRIGQRRDVQVRKLVCVDTIEERIDDMIGGKQELANLTVGAGENWITELSTDELRDLFALGAEAVGE
ncbi:DEAD/DEAH box helicase [Nocardia terpenica]|uniref:DEAD/DEAH box helicase n=1 Tax=Nocardia terpenica TaxID=455432 RepID=UPI0015C55DEC|nr:DEAD/DEAH box helicase [Nocardia terpenica]NQE85546.1 DEAD/DEAH box helicase [Nocardia terpenica]